MTPETNDRYALVRGLGLAAAISVIIGNVIGTGVFLKARPMICNLGEPQWVILAWVAAGLLSLSGALTYAELTAMKPVAGGEYVFLRDAFGRVWSFLYGWMQMFIAKPGSQAATGMAFAIGLNDFLDGSLARTLFQIDLFGGTFEVTTLQIISIMIIIIFTTLNSASVTFSGQIATALTGVKVALIFFVGIGAFFFVTGNIEHFSMFNSGGTCQGISESVRYGSPSYTFAAGFGAAMLGALWGYDGWNNLTFVAGEVKDPNRNIPLAIIGSTVMIMLLYVTVHIGYFYVLDPTTMASISPSSSVAKEVVSRFFLNGDAATFATGFGVALFAVGLMLSSLGTIHTSILSGSRVPYAMAKDGLMPRAFARTSAANVPVTALIFQGLLASVMALSGSFDTVTNYVIFASWIFYGLVTSSVFVFRRKFPNAERPYRAWGYPVVPVVFLLVVGWLIYNTINTEPIQSFIGIGLIILGLPAYYYLTNRNIGEVPTDEEGNDR